MGGWRQLGTDTNGYLYNNWYRLKIERIGTDNIRYILYKSGIGIIDSKEDKALTGFQLTRAEGSTFSNLAYIEWRSTRNPVVCPIFFWDDHKLGLTPQA